MENKKSRTKKGIVVSDKMNKTIVVETLRLKKNQKYKKYFKVSNRFKVHDEENQYHIGDEVLIEETRPISKDKRWKVVSLIKKAAAKDKAEAEE